MTLGRILALLLTGFAVSLENSNPVIAGNLDIWNLYDGNRGGR